MRALSFLLIFSLLWLPGCSFPRGASECASFAIPRAHGGDVFTFDAEGEVRMMLTIDGLVIDWKAADPQSQEQGGLNLHKGSMVQVKVAPEPALRLDMLGQERLAYQATYRANDPLHPNPLDFADEWIDVDNGNLVQANVRVYKVEGDDHVHAMRFTRIDRPALLMAPLFWERPLYSGMVDTLVFPQEYAQPPPRPAEDYGTAQLEYRVVRTYSEGGRCLADVETTLIGVIAHDLKSRATFASDMPVAVRYEDSYPKAWGVVDLTMALVKMEPGMGNSLPALQSTTLGDPVLRRLPPKDGFLAETEGVFPTSFPEALAAIRNDSTAGAWLTAHPRAVPSQVDHGMGAPGSPVVDGWIVVWADSSGDGFMTQALRTRALPVSDLTIFEVKSQPRLGVAVPVPAERWVTLAALANLHRDLYDEPVEVLRCQLVRRVCDVSTHQNTGTPYQGSFGGGISHPGVIVWMDRGWVLQEDSRAENALGPSAFDS